jgi:predicted 3-demethylubiquinone-9 3-methyltransferase (glyoxalase superfamily)
MSFPPDCSNAGSNFGVSPSPAAAPAAGGDEAKRAFDSMMTMKKIDVATIEAARRG